MKKREMIIIALVLIAAVGALVFMNIYNSGSDKYVLITADGVELAKYELTETTDEVFIFEDGDMKNNIIIKDSKVYVEWANCPNQICVHTKAAENIGDTIVCLPHKLVIEIVDK